MTMRAYLRLIPDAYERKVLGIRGPDEPPGDLYPPAAFAAFIGTMTFCEMVNPRGTFKSRRMLEALLAGPNDQGAEIAAQVGFLIAQGDLVQQPDASLYFEGWNELQEGRDPSVNDRMARYRDRKRGASEPASPGNRSVTRNATVTVRGVTRKSRPPHTAIRLTAIRPKKEDRARKSTDPQGEADPLTLVEAFLASRRANVAAGTKSWTTLVQLVDAHGAEAVIAAMEALPGPLYDGQQYIFGARNALHPIPRSNGSQAAAKGNGSHGVEAAVEAFSRG